MDKKYDDPLLNERENTHGNYVDTAYYTQCLRDTLRAHSNWQKLSYTQRDALDNIVLKLARIVVGDAAFDGHWEDVIGYAKLGMTNFMQKSLALEIDPRCEATQHSDSMVCKRCDIVYNVNDATPPICPKTKGLCPRSGKA